MTLISKNENLEFMPKVGEFEDFEDSLESQSVDNSNDFSLKKGKRNAIIKDGLNKNEENLFETNFINDYDIFSLARHNRYVELEDLFLKGVDPDSRDNYGNTILIVACQNGNKRIAKLSLRYGSKINLFNIMGNTALHFCYEYKYFDLAEYLISKGANQNIKNIRNLKSNEGIRTKTQNNLSDNSNLINSQKNKASQSKYNNYNFANISSQKSSVKQNVKKINII